MNCQRLLIFTVALGLVIVTGCTSVKPQLVLPGQDFDAPRVAGVRRLIFFNDTTVALFPTSNRIGIKLDGKGVASPYAGQYVQVDVEEGVHQVEVSHYDLFQFRDKYPVTVSGTDLYVRVYCTPTATKLEVTPREPGGLRTRFKPTDRR